MPEPVSGKPCPFVARLVALLLADEPAALGRDRQTLFSRLIDLEGEARLHGASRGTRSLIARVRRIAGTARIIAFPLHLRRS